MLPPLAHLTQAILKPFVCVGNRTIIERSLAALEALGFERLIAVAGYQKLLAGLCTALATVSFYCALRLRDVSVVAGATAASPVITLLVAAIFLGERLSPNRVMGFSAVLVGVWLLERS